MSSELEPDLVPNSDDLPSFYGGALRLDSQSLQPFYLPGNPGEWYEQAPEQTSNWGHSADWYHQIEELELERCPSFSTYMEDHHLQTVYPTVDSTQPFGFVRFNPASSTYKLNQSFVFV